MPKISWNIWKRSFPYICSECGLIHNTIRQYCEDCEKKDTLIETKRIDYKAWLKLKKK